MGLMVEFSPVVVHLGDASLLVLLHLLLQQPYLLLLQPLLLPFVAASLATTALVLGVPWSVGGWSFLAFFLPGLGVVFLVLFL